jgi:hypothetical protein
MAERVRISFHLAGLSLIQIPRLPLDSVLLVISELLPKVQELQATHQRAKPTSRIVEFLRNANLQHVLPQASNLSPRRFMVG